MTDDYSKLWAEYQSLKRAVARYISTPYDMRDDTELCDLTGDYEPSEAEQGLIPIPDGYKEQ